MNPRATCEQKRTSPEFKGHYDLVWSPDDGGFYVDLWWKRRESPTFRTTTQAREWAHKQGGVTEHQP